MSNRPTTVGLARNGADVHKPIEARVDDLEDLTAELPGLLSLRLDSVSQHLHAADGRLTLLDRQVAIHVRDVREMRGAMTRQVLAGEQIIGDIKADVAGIKAEVAGLKTNLAEILTRLSGP